MSVQCDVLHIVVVHIGTGQVLRPVHVPDLFPRCALRLRTIALPLPRKPMEEELVPPPVRPVLVNGSHLHIQMMSDDPVDHRTVADETLPNAKSYEVLTLHQRHLIHQLKEKLCRNLQR